MSERLINVSSTETLPAKTVLRVTFSKSNSLLASVNPLALNDTQFASHVNAIYESLIGGQFTPISPDPAIKDGKPAVIDVRLLHSMVLADVASAMEAIAGHFVDVSSIEKLNDAAAAVATGNDGAKQREATKEHQAKVDDDGSLAGKIGSALGVAKKVVIVAAVVAVIILALVYAPELKAAGKRLRK